MQRKVSFIRGLPGSGKTTLAKYFSKQLRCPIFEFDDYMVNKKGDFEYDPKRIDEVNEKCSEIIIEALVNREEKIIVVNHFNRYKDIAYYIDRIYQKINAIDAQFYACKRNNATDHYISRSTIDRMRINFESNESICNNLKKRYPKNRYFDLGSNF